jgi:AcrR family transcriptional regulator
MAEHYGQTVEYIVRKNGYSITELAEGLGVNRRTVYNYFQSKYLKQHIIQKIGLLVRHDFSKEFPELFTSEQFKPQISMVNNVGYSVNTDDNEDAWKNKYIQLLEHYNRVFSNRLSGEKDYSAKDLISNLEICLEN